MARSKQTTGHAGQRRIHGHVWKGIEARRGEHDICRCKGSRKVVHRIEEHDSFIEACPLDLVDDPIEVDPLRRRVWEVADPNEANPVWAEFGHHSLSARNEKIDTFAHANRAKS